ncbi:ABC transporter ATP-binding protein [Methanocella sp.]|uniref:ABC transporter ATP-binding protein n=1 Tax=Methanocella sp. TaxID=2052833 RepID=UPI002D7E30CE|nr:ABC transporter ATP-binding protein [Methanocella sp.]
MAEVPGHHMIEIERLTKMYDATHGIREIDLTVNRGVSLGLLGRNGAGKTTLVRTLIGLLKPNSGKAIVNGIDVSSDPVSVRKVIGYLPEVFGLYNDMTVYNTLDYTGRLHRIEARDRSDRIEYLLDRLELTEIKNMKTGALSKGLRQKVGFARALVNDPQVVFLDEPTSGLDPIAARGIESLIAELKKDGKTLLITSHIMPEAEKMCDCVALIKDGRLIASGKISDIKKKYSEPAVIVRLQDPASAGQAATMLRAMLPGVEATDSTVTIHGADPDKTTLMINRKLFEANIPVLEIRRQESSLDDVYFKAMEA